MIKVLGKRFFQQQWEEIFLLDNHPIDEKKPYDYKYQSRKKLEELLKDNLFELEKENIPDYKENENYYFALLGIIHFLLGKNYFETEENKDSEKFLNWSLDYFSQIDINNIYNYFLYIIEIYNILGFLSVYYEKFEIGLSYLNKSEKLIQLYEDNFKKFNETNNFNFYMKKFNNDSINNLNNDNKIEFKFFIEGIKNYEKLDNLRLNCYFYLAQVYSSIDKNQSAKYCGLTLQIQFKNYDNIDQKEFFNNLIGLADYYINEMKYNMAIYLILTTLKKLPENKYKKRRGTCFMYLGRIFYFFFKYNLSCILKLNNKEDQENFEKENIRLLIPEFLLYNNEVEFPKFNLFKNYEESKKFTRLSITYSKKASEIYILSENASTFMNITFIINDNYSLAFTQENDINRKLIILDKQKENLNIIFKDLSKKYFEEFWVRIIGDLILIYNHYSKIYIDNYKNYLNRIDKNNIEGIKLCQSLNNYYEEKLKEQPNDVIIITNISNNLIQMGFFYQRMFSMDTKSNLYYYNEGICCFNKIIKLLKNPYIILTKNLNESKKLCEEMVLMLEAKIKSIEKNINK